jgi:hypothetical protein
VIKFDLPDVQRHLSLLLEVTMSIKSWSPGLAIAVLFFCGCQALTIAPSVGPTVPPAIARPAPTNVSMPGTVQATPTIPIAQGTPTPIPPDFREPAEALHRFFLLLHDERYAEAVNYYGGSYDVLKDWNPEVSDPATLFKNGCTINGLQCLRIKSLWPADLVSPTEFRFTVEFMNADGTTYTRGPCCGATDTPPQTQFVYTVKKVGDEFLVQELPVYTP